MLKRAEMHEYQRFCVEKLKENPVYALFLEMGIGKTVITLTAISDLLQSGEIRKVLIIAPLRVAQNTWSQEAEKWEHLKHLTFSKILGNEKQRKIAFADTGKVYIINRENVYWLVKNCKFDFDTVVIDELSNFKSRKTERFRALRYVRPKLSKIWGLTGTPSPNSLLDLWSQIFLLDCGERLGRQITHYRERYFEPDKRSRTQIFSYKLRPGSENSIYEKLSDICISMKNSDYLKMPERIDNFLVCELSKTEFELYKKLESDMFLPFKTGDIDAVNAAVLSGKLLQMANGAAYNEFNEVQKIHDRKIEILEDITEAANGKSVLVFYDFKSLAI